MSAEDGWSLLFVVPGAVGGFWLFLRVLEALA